jgi:hypothetical protein
MIVALIILAALVAVGLPLYLLNRYQAQKGAATTVAEAGAEAAAGEASSQAPLSRAEQAEIDPEVCCGMHITCEKDSLLADVSEQIDYFDDEELDRFAGRSADNYEPDEIEEFRDVLLTLIPTDIAPWARSIQLRGIQLPTEVRDELLMIVAEARKNV